MYPIILVLLASACRLLPHAPNFTPIGAMALFAGSEIKDVRVAIGATLGAMVLSDLVIGADITSAAVYLALTISVLIGRYFQSSTSLRTGFISATLCAILFFVITNLAVWAFAGLYPLNFAGLTECFGLAIPFFRNTLLSDLLYLGALSSLCYLARSRLLSRGFLASS
jgi:hypothetical protein